MIKVVSPANIAFIKHWGMSLEGLPLGPSLSMNLSGCTTTTTIVENGEKVDSVELINFDGQGKFLEKNVDSRDDKVFGQIELIREMAGSQKFAKVSSVNSFPTKSGIASSASGFSALTLGLCEFYGLKVELQQLANLIAKAGSISAVRSVCNNFGQVTLSKNGNLEVSDCPVFEEFNLVDIVVIVDNEEKHTSSLNGQRVAETSPLFDARLSEVKRNFVDIKNWATRKSWKDIGRIIEQEAIMLHAVMLTSNPSQKYINSKTMEIVDLVLNLRKSGIEAYFTIDAGANVHIITPNVNLEIISESLKSLMCVKNIIINKPCAGTRLIT
jgi:diphosphomevalonate decarboxylase